LLETTSAKMIERRISAPKDTATAGQSRARIR
jgi:hypothetical protein